MILKKGSKIVYRQGTQWERKGKVMGIYKEVFGKRQLLDVQWQPSPNFEGSRYEVLAELCTLAT